MEVIVEVGLVQWKKVRLPSDRLLGQIVLEPSYYNVESKRFISLTLMISIQVEKMVEL